MGNSTTITLSAIYDAALSSEHWPLALDHFGKEIGAVGAILVAIDQVGLPFHIEQSTYPLDQLRHYFENYGHYDEANFKASMQAPPLRLLRDCDICPDIALLEERPDYKWLRENIGARRKAGVRLSNGKGWVNVITVQFAQEWAPSPDGIQARLDHFLPHVAKAVEINRQFSILKSQYQAALAALDHVRVGTCITDRNGHVVVSNNEAQRIFSLGDGLSLSRLGFLGASSAELTAELSEKIRSVTSTARGEGSEHEMVVFASRRSGGCPFLIEIAPLRDSLGELQRGLAGALIFIVDPDNQSAISTHRLSLLFALTAAEADICHHMVSGLSAAEIAEIRDVSEETVKSQIKAIYSKTGVQRRADLIRLALAVDPPIG